MKTTRRVLALALALLAVAAGCNTNMNSGSLFAERCVVYFNGKCHMSTCGSGQTFNVQKNACECEANRLSVDGACLTSVEAKQFCGKGAYWGPKGCQPIECRTGEILDLESEKCVSKEQVDKQAGVAPGKTLACGKSTVLTLSEGKGSCVPVDQSCTRDEFFDTSTNACTKLPSCAIGSVFDLATRSCVQVVAQQADSKDKRATINVTQWSQSTYGPDGGQGSPGLCGPLARKPLAFGVMPGGSVRLVINLTLGFPNSLSDAAIVGAPTKLEASGQMVGARGAQEVQATADGLLNSLRVQKVHTTAGQVSLSVKCLIVNGEAPQTVPTTGGA